MRRIIVGIDGSEAALRALEEAARIARCFHSKLTLLAVVPPLLLPSEGYPAGIEEQVGQPHREHAEQVLREAATRLEQSGLEVEEVVRFGAPAESIAEHALAEDASLVAVGSHGRGAVSRMLLGSISSRLAHICEKPVLIVH